MRSRNKTPWTWTVPRKVLSTTFGAVSARVECTNDPVTAHPSNRYVCFIGSDCVGEEASLRNAKKKLVTLCLGSTRMTKSFERNNRPLGTWVSGAEYDLFCAIAKANNVSPAAYLRGVVSDVIAEESVKLPAGAVQRRQKADLFQEG